MEAVLKILRWLRIVRRDGNESALRHVHQKLASLDSRCRSLDKKRAQVVKLLLSIFGFIYMPFVAFSYPRHDTVQRRLIFILMHMAICVTWYAVYRSLSWLVHYIRLMTERQIIGLNKQKQQIVDQVMENETYKRARELLEQYAPDALGNGRTSTLSRAKFQSTPRQLAEKRADSVYSTPIAQVSKGSNQAVNAGPVGQRLDSPRPTVQTLSQRLPRQSSEGGIHSTPADSGHEGPLPPRPVIVSGSGPGSWVKGGFMTNILEYLMGEGVNNRYALICKECQSHNGMALREDFPYVSFRCFYCRYWNAARLTRQTAPLIIAKHDEVAGFPADIGQSVSQEESVSPGQSREVRQEGDDPESEQHDSPAPQLEEVCDADGVNGDTENNEERAGGDGKCSSASDGDE